MDGFEQGTNVIVMAATNRPDVLDSALLRPGRFDRHVYLDNPDIDAREEILAVHARNKPLAKGVDLNAIARQTVGMTGADLENVMNEAAIFAAKRSRKSITQQDIVDALEKVSIGPERKSRKLNQKEKEITAYHELGHAIVGHLCKESDKLHKVSIVSRGSALGVTWFLPEEDQYTTSKQKFLDEIAGLLGGRAAEKLIFNDISTGASNDIERASHIARNMAMRYGMDDELGLVAYGESSGMTATGVDPHLARNYSEESAKKIDHFVKTTLDTQYARAMDMLKKHEGKLREIEQILLKQETLSAEEFIELFEGKTTEAAIETKRKTKKKVASVEESEEKDI